MIAPVYADRACTGSRNAGTGNSRKAARIIKSEAELDASKKLADAAQQMANNPVAVELRRMQMVTEVGAENNSPRR